MKVSAAVTPFVAILFTVLSPFSDAKPLGRSQESQWIRHRAGSRRTPSQPAVVMMEVEEGGKMEMTVIEPIMPSTAPDVMPSSFGTTTSPTMVTVLPAAEEDTTKVHKSRSGRSADRARTVYPKMCYFSPIQCMFATAR